MTNDQTARVSAARTGERLEVYHTRECRHYPDGGDDVPRADAEAWGLRKCEWCARNRDNTPGAGNGARDYAALVENLREQLNIDPEP